MMDRVATPSRIWWTGTAAGVLSVFIAACGAKGPPTSVSDPSLADAIRGARFEQVKGPSPTSLSLSPMERAIVKAGKKVLLLEVKAASIEEADSILTERAVYEWVIIDRSRMKRGVAESGIRYRVMKRADGSRALTVLEGDAGLTGLPGASLRIEGLQVNWSWRADQAVWPYVPVGYSWAKLAADSES
jgi:hypothetical protein